MSTNQYLQVDGRELIHVSIGMAGVRIGNKVWEQMCCEHGIDYDGRFVGEEEGQYRLASTFFNELVNGRMVPRGVSCDLEHNSLIETKGLAIAGLFNPGNFVVGQDRGTGNNFAKGFNTQGHEILENVLDSIRCEMENCDHSQGYQFSHSIAGGTGSGFGSLLSMQLQDLASRDLFVDFAVFPGVQASEICEETYNAALSVGHLKENMTSMIVLDNWKICQMAEIKYGSRAEGTCNWHDVNQLIAKGITGITAPQRFSAAQQADLLAMSHNVIPFPRLNLLGLSMAPNRRLTSESYKRFTLRGLMKELFSPRSFLACWDSTNPNHEQDFEDSSKFLAVSCIFRGEISAVEVQEGLVDIQAIDSDSFVSWIPNAAHSAVVSNPKKDDPISALLVSNTTAIQHQLIKLCANFKIMYDHKAYLHWYMENDVTLAEFDSAFQVLTDVIGDYSSFEAKHE